MILVLHGPNLNLLGTREPEVYGRDSLADIDRQLLQIATQAGIELQSFQSNAEGALIDRIHSVRSQAKYIIFNPGGYTHTSVALRDALLAVEIPFIEVHLSNIHKREPFRRLSYFADIAAGVICGFGSQGYSHALRQAISHLRQSDNGV